MSTNKHQSIVAEQLIASRQALPDRQQAIGITPIHTVLGNNFQQMPDDMACIIFGLGCFWGAERKFWQIDDVYFTAVGYSAGVTVNPSYQDVCSGMTGHNEVVVVWYSPDKVDLWQLLQTFWQSHDPTQGMRQGNDIGTQYRSGIYYTSDEQKKLALKSLDAYQQALSAEGLGQITTEIIEADVVYFAEDYHQQYLAKNPNGYCGLGGLSVPFPK